MKLDLFGFVNVLRPLIKLKGPLSHCPAATVDFNVSRPYKSLLVMTAL